MTSVLFDQPGPRARRRVLIGSAVAAVAFALLIYVVAQRLADNSQFDGDKWSPLFNPGDPSFVPVWKLLGKAALRTAEAAIISVALSLVIGTLLAVSRVSASQSYRWVVVAFIELFRGIPVVISIFFAARVLPEYGLDFAALWYLVIGLTVYNSVVIAEIVRAGVAAVPRGQTEAGSALGLTRGQVMRIVQLPQAFRIMLPALISQLVVIIKDTSLGFIISYQELVRTGNIIVQNLRNPIQTFLLVAILFIAVNYLLSRLAVIVERRLSRSTSGTDPGAREHEAAELTAGAGASA